MMVIVLDLVTTVSEMVVMEIEITKILITMTICSNDRSICFVYHTSTLSKITADKYLIYYFLSLQEYEQAQDICIFIYFLDINNCRWMIGSGLLA